MKTIQTHYAGRRLSTTNTAVHVFEAEDGGQLVLKKPGVTVGIGTRVTFTEPDDAPGSVYTSGEHRPQIGPPNDVPESKLIEWQALDRVTRQQLADIAQERKTKRETRDPLGDAIAVLREAMNAQRGYGARAALWRHIEQEVNS